MRSSRSWPADRGDFGSGSSCNVAIRSSGLERRGRCRFFTTTMASLLRQGRDNLGRCSGRGLKRQDPVYYEEQRKVGYIKGVEENRPAVISINTQFAGFAINESIARQRTAFAVTTGRRPTRFLQSLQKGRHVGLRNRIIRGLTREIADASHAPRCCECATSGHAATAPLRSAMKPRRLIQSPRRRGRAAPAVG